VKVRKTLQCEGIEDDVERLRFIERFALLLTEAGMQRMPARVFACVLVDDADGLTAAELAERLQVSPAAISGAVRSLVVGGMLIRDRRPGDRRDHYRLGDDLWSELYAGRLGILGRWEALLAEAAETAGADGAGARRLRESREFFAFIRRELPDLLERWREHRRTLGLG
jgi:hypothetical protein